MKRIAMVVVGMAVVGAAPGAGLYKCTDANGRTVFSQTQCAPTAEAVDVIVHRPTEAQIQEHQKQIEANQALIDEGIARRRAADAEATRRRAIEGTQAQHAAEQARIAWRRAHANNNAAGAALEGALATDAAASDARYNAEMDRLTGR